MARKQAKPRLSLGQSPPRASSAALCMLFIKTLNLHNFVKSWAPHKQPQKERNTPQQQQELQRQQQQEQRAKEEVDQKLWRNLIPLALNKWRKCNCNCNKIWRPFTVTHFLLLRVFFSIFFFFFSFCYVLAAFCVCCNLIFLLHLALWNFSANRALCIFRPFLTAVGSNWQSIFHSSGHSHSSSSRAAATVNAFSQ